jgi:NAD(P)-dependent dehydrogenase (short-subunit alcohol dehydrogenase family)
MTHLALVTGAGKRLGRAIALGLARAGCDIAVHYRSSGAEAEAVASDIHSLGRSAVTVGFDQSDDAGMSAGFAAIQRETGRNPDVLVNSASIYEPDGLADVARETLQRHFDANLFGPVLATRQMWDHSTPDTRGLIINLLDYRLWQPRSDDHLSYTLTKYALQGFTTLMAQKLAPRFRVCAIAPGYTLPDVDAQSDDHFRAAGDRTPLGRGPTADDIAAAAVYLLNAPAVTGQTLIVDGGAHTAPDRHS